ncbi:MAG: MFS transporter [Vicinamibacterales bacterium]
MTDRGLDPSDLDEAARRRQIVRAVVASAVGTSIEWYDFFLYGVAASLVFPRLFFPQSDPYVGQLASFATFFVGFVARPMGAAIFGHYGDRLGRKASLIATLLLMGVATAGIGLVPDYSRIGIFGAVLLTVGRLLQGIAVGGEWAGSVLLAAEWGDKRRRGFIASWPQFGAPAGMVLANGAQRLMTAVSGDAFMTWGWRVPFLLSIVLVGIGLYIRVGVLETPVFAKLKEEGRVQKAPVLVVVGRHSREIVLTALLRTGQQVPFYIFTTFVLTYGTQTLGLGRDTVLSYVLIMSALSMVAIPFWGHVSDRVGRRLVTAIGCWAMVVWPFVYFGLLDSLSLPLIFVGILLSQSIHDIQYGPQAAVIAEAFPGPVRYSGASLGYQLASITAGGPAPIAALWLLNRYQSSTAIAVYISASALVSLVALWLLPDHSHD